MNLACGTEMSYEISLKMAWDELATLATESEYSVDFLADGYVVRLDGKSIISEASGYAADEVAAVLVLHYLIGILKCGFHPRGEWISFKELRGGNVFWPAFSKSTIEPLAAYLQQNIQQNLPGSAAIIETHDIRRVAKLMQDGSVAMDVAAFPDIFVRVIFWKGDDELPCDATMFFDRGLAEIYGTEDIAVLLMRVAEKIIR
ncbi:MAG: DUF3786 domain-containing protein [Methanothrix sp.]|nr:MAG: DUF3786 domain-containing protein [Methanothrix sp.]